MVNINQIQRGLERYIDAEFVQKASGLQRWAIAIGGEVLVQKAMKTVSVLSVSPELRESGFTDDSGNVDIDTLYQKARAAAATPVTEQLPMLGAVTFTADDVDRLYHLILNS